MPESINFLGEVILVTGAASGLGWAIAAAFGQAGATVALHDRSLDRATRAAMELSRQGIACCGFHADVRDANAVRGMVNRVVDELGAPRVVVANAGIYPNTPFLDTAEEEWDRVLDTNLKGTFLTCQAAAKMMVSAGRGGQLITIASEAANRAIWGWSHYCASKAAIVMLTRSMALELGEHGIRVNSVLPGYIDVLEGGDHLDEAYRRAVRSASPLGRPGEPEDIARAVLMLASPLAGYISGAAMAVDGGASAGSVNIRPT